MNTPTDLQNAVEIPRIRGAVYTWRFRQTHSASACRVRCIVPLDPKLILPGQYGGVRGAGAVVADDHARTSPYLDDVVKFTRHAHSGERGVHDQTHAFRVKSSTTVRMRKRRPMTTYPSRSRATSADSDPAGSLSSPNPKCPFAATAMAMAAPGRHSLSCEYSTLRRRPHRRRDVAQAAPRRFSAGWAKLSIRKLKLTVQR